MDPAVQGDAPAWHQENGYRWSPLAIPAQGHSGFAALPPAETGVNFTNFLAEYSIATNRVLANGSGVAIGDYNRDGLPDIFLCGLETPSVLYRNLGGWKFKPVTSESGINLDKVACRGAVFADVNGDGFLDLLVTTFDEGVRCFLNDGHERFADATAAAGTRSQYGSMTMTLADVDGNGTLDLYVADYRPSDMRDKGKLSLPAVNGQPIIPPKDRNHFQIKDGHVQEFGQPDQLFLNDGAGHFREASWTDGTFLDESGAKLAGAPLDWGLTASFRDVNGDLAPDLYVCNDYWTPDRFWINDGHGHFQAIEPRALRHTSSSSMGVDFADLDRDGILDFFVVDMLSADPRLRKRQSWAEKPVAAMTGVINDRPQVMRNTLFRGRTDGTYEEIADFARLAASDWSWSPVFVDVDLDGYEDLLISAGHFRDVQDQDAERSIQAKQHPWPPFKDEASRQQAYSRELMEHYRIYPPLDMPIRSFRNAGGWTFTDTTKDWGTGQLAVHHGMAMGDLDGDGDLDLVVNNLNGAATIYRNESSAGRVKVRLKGKVPNTEGIGAKVTLLDGAVPVQTSEIISGGRYLSGSEACVVFATGKARDGMTLEVRWRGGTVSTITGVQANRCYDIDEQVSQPAPSRKKPVTSPMFRDVSESLAHTHHESDFNDFERQPLLPFKLSQAGPGIAWFDLDGDGHEDLIVGAGREGKATAFRSDGKGGFSRMDAPEAAPDDLAGLAGWTDPAGNRMIFAGVTGYEAPIESALKAYELKGTNFASRPVFPVASHSAGPVAIGDIDGKGNWTMFIGGGVSPEHYPLGTPSLLYFYDAGEWKLDARNSPMLDNLGIVNGAIWSDLNGDGNPELIVACEWGTIRVWQPRAGIFHEITTELGLARITGLWKGLAVGDFDNDGRMDIVAANWGLNTPYQASSARPLTLVHGQLFRPGVTDLIETEYDPLTGGLTPRRQILTLGASLPFLFEQFANAKAYSEAGLAEVLGERKVLARQATVTTLATTVFLNRGGRFEAVPLPMEAQLAPAFSANVSDFDGDGSEDIFLSQNFSPFQPETPRADAGRGLLLRGDGRGHFTAMPGERSGLLVAGEQRGAAAGDFNEDGRVDLVVTQNGAATRLFQNTSAKPGMRVRLEGGVTNPCGAGAILRLRFGERFGPAREIHMGSGYWSQDGAVQVLATPAQPALIQVQWPGGKITTTALPPDIAEIALNQNGEIMSRR
ncbi:MAG TPA: VCBS repeat-containing protein [Verrucomicrobiae bacterium]|nr:VCBS repeat-containing protein [Verrucomicrobiae bacterium]